jgi:hypothetical protein
MSNNIAIVLFATSSERQPLWACNWCRWLLRHQQFLSRPVPSTRGERAGCPSDACPACPEYSRGGPRGEAIPSFGAGDCFPSVPSGRASAYGLLAVTKGVIGRSGSDEAFPGCAGRRGNRNPKSSGTSGFWERRPAHRKQRHTLWLNSQAQRQMAFHRSVHTIPAPKVDRCEHLCYNVL